MGLTEYDQHIKPHLEFIASGSAMAARHANLMLAKPGFETVAQDELKEAERVLETALSKIRSAKQSYEQTPVEA